MKQLLLITLTILFTSCNAQKTIILKKFDIKTFNKHKDTIRKEYNRTLDDGTVIEQMELKEVFAETIRQKNSFFEVKNQYYKNGTLKITGKYFNSSFQKGIWKEYDEKGSLIKETDYDKDFEYTWEDLVKLLKERKVDIQGRYTYIQKEEGNWRIWYVKGIFIHDVTINGKTGKIIDDSKNEFEEGS